MSLLSIADLLPKIDCPVGDETDLSSTYFTGTPNAKSLKNVRRSLAAVALGQQSAMGFHFHRGRRLDTYRNPQRGFA
jgi:hypothetical protein